MGAKYEPSHAEECVFFGTQTAAGILLSAVNAEGGDQKGAVLLRGPAIVKDAALDWGDADDNAIAAGKTDLEALGILVQR